MKEFLRRYKKIVAAVAAGAVLLAVLWVLSLGYYPILLVNGRVLTAHEYAVRYAAATRYSQKVVGAIDAVASSSVRADVTEGDLRAVALDQLVEEELVHETALAEFGSSYAMLVSDKVSKYDTDQKLQSASANLFGLSFPDFKKQVLYPQAERELLAGRLFLEGKNLNDWLAAARRDAKVHIFSNSFAWNGDRVVTIGR